MKHTESEALEAEAAAMDNSLDALTAAIDAVESKLRNYTRLKVRTKTAIPHEQGETDRHFLVWALHAQTGWSLHVLTRQETGEERFTLLKSAPWRLRVRATSYFDALLVQASLDLRHMKKDVQEAIERCVEFTKKLEDQRP